MKGVVPNMARRNQQMLTTIREYGGRPVTKKDSWCVRSAKKKEGEEAPWGYVVTVPIPKKGVDLKRIDGSVVRTKKRGKFFLLQVIPSSKNPQYRITADAMLRNGKANRRRATINVRRK